MDGVLLDDIIGFLVFASGVGLVATVLGTAAAAFLDMGRLMDIALFGIALAASSGGLALLLIGLRTLLG